MGTFHAGEQALQAREGLRDRLAEIGHLVVRDRMPDQHRKFFAGLPTLLVGVQDDQGQPWATMLQGPPGFVSSPDAVTLAIRAKPAEADPVARWLVPGAGIGLLGLEAHTRRRNRANGRIEQVQGDGFDVRVLQSFGNCPKYIHGRRPAPASAQRTAEALPLGGGLDDASKALLSRADTLFIASASGRSPGRGQAEGVDISHRGGLPGFIRVDERPQGVRLTIPDYSGNAYFNTLGNLMVWPLAGLLVPDFEDGSLLHLAAEASIEHEGAALAEFEGAERLLHLDVVTGWRRPGAVPLRWSAPVVPKQFAA